MTGIIVYISGTRWDAVQGTDRLLAEALASRADVIWVDQPVSAARYSDVRRYCLNSLLGITEPVAPAVRRLRIPALPGFSRPLVRRATEAIAQWTVGKAAARDAGHIVGVVIASPIVAFPAHLEAPRMLHLTDDWLGSADLLGLSRTHVGRMLKQNLESADIISAVSPDLAEKISNFSGRSVELLPNGCRTPVPLETSTERQPVAALVGQLNERLDFNALQALGRARIPMVVLGPRTDRDASTRRNLDDFLSLPCVDWRGEVSPSAVAKVLGTVSLGLTPYADSEFNRSSFPLKTLEYLAAGVPVVATDLPATRWLKSDFVSIATSSADFMNLVQSGMRSQLTLAQRRAIQSTAQAHTWDVRASKLLSLLGRQGNPATMDKPLTTGGPRHFGSR
ncbi:glycosyltransferase [Paenarthrobacter nitroguajacolicus]|uniref:glycosyltransferase n=1 Tax=Paenarthrobacter nitroguajacolicus TaxID=211146 RepID=UPI00405449CE